LRKKRTKGKGAGTPSKKDSKCAITKKKRNLSARRWRNERKSTLRGKKKKFNLSGGKEGKWLLLSKKGEPAAMFREGRRGKSAVIAPKKKRVSVRKQD